MAYSHARLKKMLALVRIALGFMFAVLGASKLASIDFAWSTFPTFLSQAIHGGAIGWYGDVLRMLVPWAGKIAVAVGFFELLVGISLIVGIAVRPVAVLGIVYMFHLVLATWHNVSFQAQTWEYVDTQVKNLCPMLIFLLLAIGHAGETWGFGAVYHRHAEPQWEFASGGAGYARSLDEEEDMYDVDRPSEV